MSASSPTPSAEDARRAELAALLADQTSDDMREKGLDIVETGDVEDVHAEDEPDLEGYDDEQRAEIEEVERAGPSDGTLITNLYPDRGWTVDADATASPLDPIGPEDEGQHR